MKRQAFFWVSLLICGLTAYHASAQPLPVKSYTGVMAADIPVRPVTGEYSYLSEGYRNYHGHDHLYGALLPVDTIFDTGSDPTYSGHNQYDYVGKERPLSLPALVIPAVGITYGIVALHDSAPKDLNVSTKDEIREDHPHFMTHVDNFLQWSPAAAVIALNVAGVPGERPFATELHIYVVSMAIMGGTVFTLKHVTHEQRPDLSSFTSFPSGHSATAFAAAEWLRTEYWQRSPWIGIAGYAAATATGALRVYNNRHWVSDVVAGAAIGFLSTRIAYAADPWLEHHVFHRKRDESQ